MGGDNDDESRQTISAAQLLSMGSCSAEEIGHIRLIVAWGNAFEVSTDGLSKMLEKGSNTHSLGMKVADKLSQLTPQPSPMGQGAVGWALGVILCWSPGARSFGSPRR